MHSLPEIGAFSALLDFLLQSAAAWLVCSLLVRIACSAERRFQIWLSMILALAARWVWICATLWLGQHPTWLHYRIASRANMPRVLQPTPAHSVVVSMAWARHLPQILHVLLYCYAAALLMLALAGITRRLRLYRAMRFRLAPSSALQQVFLQSAGKLPSCPPALWVLPGLTSPATLGWWRPQIVVPPVCETQNTSDLREMFWHELKHIQRRDALWNTVAKIGRILLWFHPAVHLAVKRMRVEREIACDLAVICDHPQSRAAYAECLLRFARLHISAQQGTTLGIELTAPAHLLSTRVRYILAEAQPVSAQSRSLRFLASLALLGALTVATAEMRIALQYQLPFVNPVMPFRASLMQRSANHKLRRGRTEGLSRSAARLSELAAGSPGPYSDSSAPDARLAGSHRAGMSIVTEATGLEDTGTGNNAAGDGSWQGREAASSSRALRPSWTSIAAGAATGVVMIGDHDHDHDGH